MRYLRNLAVVFSQTLNALTGGFPDETLCSRAYRKAQEGCSNAAKFCAFINKVFFWEEDHCKDSYDAEVEQRHTSTAIRKARANLNG